MVFTGKPMPKISIQSSQIKRKTVFRVVLGYLVALIVTLSIIFLVLTRLNNINHTVDDLTNRLAETRSLSQSVIAKLQLVNFYENRYRHFHNQNDLDLFNEKLADLKTTQNKLVKQISNQTLLRIIQNIQNITAEYEREFENTTQLVMYQQSLLSTQLIKQELLIENQLSAIRINVANIQVADIFFAFGNARNAFELMRLSQSKYLNEQNEKYYVMFKNNYKYATKAFTNLSNALNIVTENNHIALNADKAKTELELYYETFILIHMASINTQKSSDKLANYQRQITQIASDVATTLEIEYKKHNQLTQDLVQQTKLELLSAIIVALLLNLVLIFIVLQKIISPIFYDMQSLSNLDGLTKIANRRYFDVCLQKERERTKRENQALSLIMCDVDHFKIYNDTYGHQMGDECLQKIAETINKACNRPGDLAARYGGEEFTIILPNTVAADALFIANKIKQNIEALKIPHSDDSDASYVTMSMGITTTSEANLSIETLILRADKALYRAKSKGRNCISTWTALSDA